MITIPIPDLGSSERLVIDAALAALNRTPDLRIEADEREVVITGTPDALARTAEMLKRAGFLPESDLN